jgi:putative transposase
MSRPPRAAEGGLIYHALNRANAGLAIFDEDGDYDAFDRVLTEAVARYNMRLLAYCLMPSHFHLVVWPEADGDLSRFMRWLTMTHTQRWHAHHASAGSGHLYQGRFKSFPVQDDGHFLTLCRYVERNALRAGLVTRAEDWRWGSLWRHVARRATSGPTLTPWPVARSRGWARRVNEPLSPAEDEALQRAIRRGQPFGSDGWRESTASRLGLGSARPSAREAVPGGILRSNRRCK